MKYFLWTAYGDSKNVSCSTIELKFQGLCQCSGAETVGDPYHKQVPLPSIPAYRAREATT